MSVQQLPLPPFRRIKGKNLFVEDDARAYVARIFDLPPPPPSPEVRLITAGEFAAMLRCSKFSMRKDISRQARKARQAAADSPDHVAA